MSNTISTGKVVRAQGWPGTKGERFLVTEITEQPKSGAVAFLREYDGGKPFRFRAIPVANLRVDMKATRRERNRDN